MVKASQMELEAMGFLKAIRALPAKKIGELLKLAAGITQVPLRHSLLPYRGKPSSGKASAR